MSTIKVVGETIYNELQDQEELQNILDKLKNHVCDSIRCYAPYLISLNEKLEIQEKLNQAKSLVADQHFGVREIVWMALRPEIDNNLEKSIKLLTDWTNNKDENIRPIFTESFSR